MIEVAMSESGRSGIRWPLMTKAQPARVQTATESERTSRRSDVIPTGRKQDWQTGCVIPDAERTSMHVLVVEDNRSLVANLFDWPWHLAGSGAVWAIALGGIIGSVALRS